MTTRSHTLPVAADRILRAIIDAGGVDVSLSQPQGCVAAQHLNGYATKDRDRRGLRVWTVTAAGRRYAARLPASPLV